MFPTEYKAIRMRKRVLNNFTSNFEYKTVV